MATQPATLRVSECYCLSVHSVGAFFETLSRLLRMCVCQGVRPLHTLPLPLFSIISGTHSHPGENPGLSQSSRTGCFGPAPSPLWFTVKMIFSVYLFIYCMQIPCGPYFCSLLVFFFGFFLSFLVTHCLLVHGRPSPTWRDISCNLAIPQFLFLSSLSVGGLVQREGEAVMVRDFFGPPTSTTLPPRPLPDWQT